MKEILVILYAELIMHWMESESTTANFCSPGAPLLPLT